jgi:hypothetical protein
MPLRGVWASRNLATSLLSPTSVIKISHLADDRKQEWNLVKQNNE